MVKSSADFEVLRTFVHVPIRGKILNKIISIFLALLCLIMVISACSSCSLDTEETGTTYPNGNSVTTGVTSGSFQKRIKMRIFFPRI